MRFSDTTLALLSRRLGSAVRKHVEIDNLLLEHDLGEFDEKDAYLGERANRLISGVRKRYATDEHKAEKVIVALTEHALSLEHGNPEISSQLERSLELDGFKWTGERLLPTTPRPAELSHEISILETKLKNLQLNVSAGHYRQACESFVAGNWASANGQIRSFIEDLYIEMGQLETLNRRSNPAAALQDLSKIRFFDEAEGQMLKAFWQGIQDNGPHPGLSDQEESLFRLHIATAVARYSLNKLRQVGNAT